MRGSAEPRVTLEDKNTGVRWLRDSHEIINQSYADVNHNNSPSKDSSNEATSSFSLMDHRNQVSASMRRPIFKKHSVAPKLGNFSGIYMFGGLNEKKVPTSDLFLIQPHFKKNHKYISQETTSYSESLRQKGAKLCFRVIKLKPEQMEGQVPCPRHSHAATYFKHYLVIHGGRNDKLFPHLGNIGLNDMHMFNILTKTWISIAIYNDLPTSRWGHQMVNTTHNLEAGGEEEILLLGGVGITSFCDTSVYKFHFSKSIDTDRHPVQTREPFLSS